MPRKRSNYWSCIKKEKQRVTARLIEISLKVDAYVYNHIPITEIDAKQYIEEVASYRIQCAGDERSLQVIEKLIRCMNAVVKEYKELENHFCNINDVRSNNNRNGDSMSPVYSISDEDRTQLAEIADKRVQSYTEANQYVEIIDLCDIDDDKVSEDDISNTDAKVGGSSIINVEVEIHKAISNLSLGDVEDLTEKISLDGDFSQSILNNFEGLEDMGQKNINVDNAVAIAKQRNVLNIDQNVDNITSKNNLLNKVQNNVTSFFMKTNKDDPNLTILKPSTTTAAKCNLKDKTIAQNTESFDIFNTTNNVKTAFCQKGDQRTTNPQYPRNHNYDLDRTCTIPNYCLQVSHLAQTRQMNEVVNLNSNTLNINNNFNAVVPIAKAHGGQDAIHTKINLTDTARENLNSDKPVNNEPAVKDNTTTAKKKRAPRKKKVSNENEIRTDNKKSKRGPKPTHKIPLTKVNVKDKNIPIYNTNIENDLSWIENIRYVREIRADEHDCSLIISESFWDNNCLPDRWNENEFL